MIMYKKEVEQKLKKKLFPKENPFECDCELVWLREYLEAEEERRVDRYHQNGLMGRPVPPGGDTSGRGLLPGFPTSMHGQPVCAGPEEYAGKPITQVYKLFSRFMIPIKISSF